MPGLAMPTTPGQRQNHFSDRRLLPGDIYPGAILWMPSALNESSEANRGKYDHPIVVLHVGGTRARDITLIWDGELVAKDHVLVVGVTTFNGTFLTEHFADNHNPEYRRRGYIPLECIPPTLHPDTGLILETNCLERRPSMVYTQSYVALEPFAVPKQGLVRLKDGKIELKHSSLQLLKREIKNRELGNIRDSPSRGISSMDGRGRVSQQRDIGTGGYGIPTNAVRQQPPPPPPPPPPPSRVRSLPPPPAYTPPHSAANPSHTSFNNTLVGADRYGSSQNARPYGTTPVPPRTTVPTRYANRYSADELEAQVSDSSQSETCTVGDILVLGIQLCIAGVCGYFAAQWWYKK